jgi:hypothetical protein
MTLEITLIDTLPVSAASALVEVHETLWAIADDETMLIGTDASPAWTERIVLVPDVLPSEAKERKRRKPDFESIAVLPDDSLFVLGSGSTSSRRRGVVVDIDVRVPRIVDLTPLYLALEVELPELNIEGAVVHGESLWLAQRGNGASYGNALVRLDLGRALASISKGELAESALVRIVPVVLPMIEGVPFGFTDLASDGHDLYFSAAAEDSASTYLDGACLGSILGRLNDDGSLAATRSLPGRAKIEGLTLSRSHAGTIRALLVADPDDPNVNAPLYRIDRLELP